MLKTPYNPVFLCGASANHGGLVGFGYSNISLIHNGLKKPDCLLTTS